MAEQIARIDRRFQIAEFRIHHREDTPVDLLHFVPGFPVGNAGGVQTVLALKDLHSGSGIRAVNPVNGHSGDIGVKVGKGVEIVLDGGHRQAGIAHCELSGIEKFSLVQTDALAVQVSQLLDAGVDLLDPVPGGLIHHAGHRHIEYLLEHPDCLLGGGIKDTVLQRNPWDSREIPADAVQRLLDDIHIVVAVPQFQRHSGIGFGEIFDGGVLHQFQIVPVIGAQDLQRVQSLVGEVYAAPLGQSVTGDCGAAAELGKERIGLVGTAEVVVENLIHDVADIFEHIPVLDKGLVELGRGSDVEIIAPAAVPFGIDAVEGKGDLGVDVGPERLFGPGGIDLTGRHILDIVGERDLHIFCRLVGGAQVDDDGFRHNREPDFRRRGFRKVDHGKLPPFRVHPGCSPVRPQPGSGPQPAGR